MPILDLQHRIVAFPSLRLDSSRGTISYGAEGTGGDVVLLDPSVDTGAFLLFSRRFAEMVTDERHFLGGDTGTWAVSMPTTNAPSARRSRRPRREALAIHEKIAWIRSALSLKISEAAAVFQVERPTVYAWLAGDARPQPANQLRIDRIFSLARQWAILSSRPLGDAVRIIDQGASIVDLLRKDEIPVQTIADRFDAIAHRPLVRTYGQGERRLAGERVRRAAAQRGLDPQAVEVDEATINVQTGRRAARDG